MRDEKGGGLKFITPIPIRSVAEGIDPDVEQFNRAVICTRKSKIENLLLKGGIFGNTPAVVGWINCSCFFRFGHSLFFSF